jgi:hypothetical protein
MTYELLILHLIAINGGFSVYRFVTLRCPNHKTFIIDNYRIDCAPTHDARSEYAGPVYAWSR